MVGHIVLYNVLWCSDEQSPLQFPVNFRRDASGFSDITEIQDLSSAKFHIQ